jgi:hypothetical protein
MGQFFFGFSAIERQILVILDNLAKKGVEVSEAVVVMLSDPGNDEHHKKIHALETKADSLVREIFSELNSTFITPLDREDMQRVASKIDDTIDHMDGIASRLHSYKITTTPPHALDIANELVKATKEVELMTAKLRNIKNPSSMIEHCRNTSAIEHKVDDLYSVAITKLFESNDAIEIIKLKDIYEKMESASDRCVDVADVFEDIVLKYT